MILGPFGYRFRVQGWQETFNRAQKLRLVLDALSLKTASNLKWGVEVKNTYLQQS